MATALEDMTECPICAESYNDPKILPCDHTICSNCVNKIKTENRIVCPMCKTASNIKDIKSDFRLAQFLDALAQKVEELTTREEDRNAIIRKCEVCDVKQISFHCDDCSQWICADCKKNHRKIPALASHSVAPLRQKNNQVQATLQQELAELKAKRAEYEVSIAAVKDVIQKTRDTETKTLDEAKQMKKECLEQVQRLFEQTEKRIKESCSASLLKDRRQEEELQKGIKTMDGEITTLEQLLKAENIFLAIDGSRAVETAKALNCSIPPPDVEIESLDIKLKKRGEWNAVACDIEITKNKTCDSRAVSTARSTASHSHTFAALRRRYDNSIVSLTTATLRDEKTILIDREIRDMHVINSHLWCCTNNSFLIYNQQLEIHKQFIPEKINRIWGFTYIPTSGEIVVATSEALFRITKAGRLIESIDGGNFDRVQYYKGHLYAAEQESHTVLIYNTKQRFKKVKEIAEKCCWANQFLTLSVCNEAITVCCLRGNKITKFSLTGKHRHTYSNYGTTEAGHLNAPRICDEDKSGILIADMHNSRLQVCDKQGKWHVIKTEPRIEDRPLAATFWNNKLYVYHQYPKSLSIFS